MKQAVVCLALFLVAWLCSLAAAAPVLLVDRTANYDRTLGLRVGSTSGGLSMYTNANPPSAISSLPLAQRGKAVLGRNVKLLSDASTVPEPSTVLMLGAGLTLFGILRRLRR